MQSDVDKPLPTIQEPIPTISKSPTDLSYDPNSAKFANPLDFLNAAANEPIAGKEARAAQKPFMIDPQRVADTISKEPTHVEPQTPKPEEVIEPKEAPIPLKKDALPTFFEEETPKAPAAPGEEPSKLLDDEEDIDSVTNPNATHFQRLRAVHKAAKADLKKAMIEREELANKLKQYESGEATPEILKAKDEEIARLLRYEKMVNLKGSKEYKEKFIVPIENAKTQLKEIFADYGIPPEELDTVVNNAVNIQGRPNLNRFLMEHLGNDDLGAAEAKAHILKVWDVRKQAEAAEAEPAQALTTLQKEMEAVNSVRENERRNRIITTAQNTWLDTLNEVRAEGKLVELIHKEDDPEFNANFPDRLLPQAAKEYGKLVTELGRQGITELPKELAKAIAKMVLLSHASGVAVQTRQSAIDYAESLTQNLTRQHNMLRPPIGGGVPSSNGAPAPKKAPTPEEDAEGILRSVLSKR